MKISADQSIYQPLTFGSEEELEKTVIENSDEIFGKETVYLDTKHRVKHQKTTFVNIPDGYVLDFREDPKLWVVENELSTHDSFKHVGIQMLQFATQFSDGSYQVKEIVISALNQNDKLQLKALELAQKRGYQNLGEALDYAIYRNEYGFVIVIDEAGEDLSRVVRELARQPEIISLRKFRSQDGKVALLFDELLGELVEAKSSKVKDILDIDTIVCPARAEGHKEAFLDQKAWWAVRISASVLPRLKYLAMYEVSPVKAINWAGRIETIKPYEDTGKYKIFLSDIFKVGPIELNDPKLAPQSPRYTKFELLQGAKYLSDIF